MRHGLPLSIIGLTIAATLTMAPNAHAASPACETIMNDASAAAGDIEALRALHNAADQQCQIAVSAAVSRKLGFALFNEAREVPEGERVAILKDAARYAKDWRILAGLGSEQLRAGDRTGAAESLQSALIVIQETPPDPPPPPAVVQKLLTMANNARAAAPSYVKAQTTRSGDPGGVAADRVAGVDIEAVPFPIEFVFNETTPTEDGAFAIADLADIMAASAARQSGGFIVLAGHTDPVGDEASNRVLSERRAEAVREALLATGKLQGLEIRTMGCGETSPPRIESPEFYSTDEIHQIMRRVELVRAGDPC
ncbi:MAG: OmpA family protein [Pseudomonadota bacterium]